MITTQMHHRLPLLLLLLLNASAQQFLLVIMRLATKGSSYLIEHIVLVDARARPGDYSTGLDCGCIIISNPLVEPQNRLPIGSHANVLSETPSGVDRSK